MIFYPKCGGFPKVLRSWVAVRTAGIFYFHVYCKVTPTWDRERIIPPSSFAIHRTVSCVIAAHRGTVLHYKFLIPRPFPRTE